LEKSLITFKYSNDKKYNGFIYLGKEEKLILVKDSILKTSRKVG